MPESYISLNDTGRQRSECPSETSEITAVGFLKSWLPFLWMYSHSPLFQSKDTEDSSCLEEHITHQNSVKGISANTNQKEEIGKNKKCSSCFGWKCIFQGIRPPKIYTFNLNGYQGVSMMTSQALEVSQERHGNSMAGWIREDKAEYRNMGVKWDKGTLLGVSQMRAEHSTLEKKPHRQSQGCNQGISHVGKNAVKLRSQAKSWEDKSAGEARRDKSSCNSELCKSRGEGLSEGAKEHLLQIHQYLKVRAKEMLQLFLNYFHTICNSNFIIK